MSFQISLTPTRRAAAYFIGEVRDKLVEALVDRNRANGLTQSDVAREIGVHRSVINKELRGRKDITLGRVAELAEAMGFLIDFKLVEPQIEHGVSVEVAPSVTPSKRNFLVASVGNWPTNFGAPKLAGERVGEPMEAVV